MALALSGFVQVPTQAPEASLFRGHDMESDGTQYRVPGADWPRLGIASWYSRQDPGIRPLTASGELFADTELTAAMWNVPFGSCVQVVNLKTLERITVRVNDRGPHQRLVSAGRVIDLSRAAFAQLADLDDGLIPVALEPASRTRCISAYASLNAPAQIAD